MDNFGIGSAIKSVANTYFLLARGSGRTTLLVENVKDGDRIVFDNIKEAKRVERLCIDRGVNVECIVVDHLIPDRIFEHGTSIGRTIFDHSFIERYYMKAIEQIQKDIDNLERQSSGYGEKHRETKRMFKDMKKWIIE